MRTRLIDVRKNHPCVVYFQQNTTASRAVRNTANFLIRNTMTGLKKEEHVRTALEKEALEQVFTGIDRENANRKVALRKGMGHVVGVYRCHGLCSTSAIHRLLKRATSLLQYPTKEHWMLNYYQLDAILKQTQNPSYYACCSQVNQKAIKKTIDSWTAYFKSLKDWKLHPEKYTGKPRLPKYIKTKETTAQWTKQVAKLVTNRNGKLCLKFTNCEELFVIGSLPGALEKVEVKPIHGGYRLYITYAKEYVEIERPAAPKRILGIDVGTNNFLTCVGNFGENPFLVDGRWLKSENQWFNKERARLLSCLTRGEDSKHSTKQSKRLHALSRKREQKFRDFFYKTAHAILKRAGAAHVEAIVIGHNERQKDEMDTGKVNNQNFVSIPFETFRGILRQVAADYGICVIDREESYTSKASFLDHDRIPTYQKDDKHTYPFSGRRIKRGLYRSKEGILLNADVNGACNIICKEYPAAFEKIEDFSYLWKSVQRITRVEICKVTNKNVKPHYQMKKSVVSYYRHKERKELRQQYEALWGKKKATGTPAA